MWALQLVHAYRLFTELTCLGEFIFIFLCEKIFIIHICQRTIARYAQIN